MILLLAVVAGLVAGLTRAWIKQRPYQTSTLKSSWLVTVGVLPQLATFFIPGVRELVPVTLVKILLFFSFLALLAFIIRNLTQPGMWIVGLGLLSNLLVILVNGGLMPISPKIVQQIYPQAKPEAVLPGMRLGWTKDIIVPESNTRFIWLSDRFITPNLWNWQYAFSVGDVIIAIGIIWLLWSLGDPVQQT
jgi:hypothetical protein